MSKGHELIARYDELLEKEPDEGKRKELRAEANEKMAQMLKKETQTTLDLVLFELSSKMKNAFARSDA